MVALRKRGQPLIAYSLKLGWIQKWNTKWNEIRDVLKMHVTGSSNGAYDMNNSDALWTFLRDGEVLGFRSIMLRNPHLKLSDIMRKIVIL